MLRMSGLAAAVGVGFSMMSIWPAESQAYDGCGINRDSAYDECLKSVIHAENALRDAIAHYNLERQIEAEHHAIAHYNLDGSIDCGDRCQSWIKTVLGELAQAAPELLRDPTKMGRIAGRAVLKASRIEVLLPTVLSDGMLTPEQAARLKRRITNEGLHLSSETQSVATSQLGRPNSDDSFIDDIAVAGLGSAIGFGTAAGVTGATLTTGTTTIVVGVTSATTGAAAVGAGVTFACGPVCWVAVGTVVGGAGLWALYKKFRG